MLNLESHVTMSEESRRSVQHNVLPPPDIPTKDILVKIRLEPNEGVTPAQGRYSTFYNMYFVNKDWYNLTENKKMVAKRFAAFIVLDCSQANSMFSETVYGAEFFSWFSTNISKYYMLVPITTVRKNQFRFAGVHIPTNQVSRGNGAFHVRGYQLQAVDLCVYGTWGTAYGDGTIHFSQLGNLRSVSNQKKYFVKQREEIGEWITNNMESLCCSGSIN